MRNLKSNGTLITNNRKKLLKMLSGISFRFTFGFSIALFVVVTILNISSGLAAQMKCGDTFNMKATAPSPKTQTDFKKVYFDLLDQIEAAISGLTSSEDIFNYKQSTDLRAFVFKLQGIGKVLKDFESDEFSEKYSKEFRKYFSKLKDSSKELEDVLGQYGKAFEVKENVLSSELYEKEDYLKVADEMIALEKTKVKNFLKETHWLSLTKTGKLSEFRKDASNLDWPEESELREYIVSSIEKYGEEVQKKIESDDMTELIMKPRYDYESLELGLHEVRRSIRWLAIMIQNFDLYFSRGPIPASLSVEDQQLVEKFKDSPFAQLRGNPGSRNTVKVNSVLFFKLNKFISDLGKLKDWGESRYYVPRLVDKNAAFEFEKEIEAQTLIKKLINSGVLTELFTEP